MIKRVVTRIGDIFSVKIDDNSKKYFQLIAFDLTMLNSDVIRAFKKVYPADEKPDLNEIVKGEVEFYAHSTASAGVKWGLWEKVGKSADVGDTSQILFRDTNDYGSSSRKTKEPVKISERWYVWHINDDDFTCVGKLKGENRKAEIGVVIPPHAIEERIKTGKYSFVYPGFE